MNELNIAWQKMMQNDPNCQRIKTNYVVFMMRPLIALDFFTKKTYFR